MCLLCIPYAKDFLVRYSRGLLLNSRMPHSLDKVCFKYGRLACFNGFLHITFGRLVEPNKQKVISFYNGLLVTKDLLL
jgi:hypothetical protein